MKEQLSKITSNPLGAGIGGLAVFFIAKKHFHISHVATLVGITVLGVIAGGLIENKIKARKSVPTASTVK